MRLSLVILSLLLAQASHAQDTDWEKEHLEGKLKSIVERRYDTTRYHGRTIYVHHITRRNYNEKGLCLHHSDSTINYNVEKGRTEREVLDAYNVTYRYEDNGRLHSSSDSEYSYNIEHQYPQWVNYHERHIYDEKGREILSFECGSDKFTDTFTRYTKSYDDSGRIYDYKIFPGKSNEPFPDHWRRYLYDAKGRVIGEDIYSREEKKFVPSIRSIYNEQGQLISKEGYNIDGMERIIIKYKYDKKGDVIWKGRYQGELLLATNIIYLDKDPQGNYRRIIMTHPESTTTRDVITRQIEYYP